MNEQQLLSLAVLLQRHAGLDLGRGGMTSNLKRFVQERLESTQLSIDGYLEQLGTASSPELQRLLESMTIVYTWFFRDPGQFRVVEQLISSWPKERVMRIWVAGCATGEEAYSVALIASRLGKSADILGTDLNREALAHAEGARYSATSLRAVDTEMRSRYLGNVEGVFTIPEPARRMVRFQNGNLVDAPPRAPSKEGWHLILCRNVLIYFEKQQARRTLDAMGSSLAPGGHIILGASESILEGSDSLTNVGIAGRAVLQRPESTSWTPTMARISANTFDSARAAGNRRLDDVARAPSSAPRTPSTVTARAAVLSAAPLSGVSITQAASYRAMAPILPSAAGQSLQGVLALGHSLLDAGNVHGALDTYAQAITLDPSSAEALMYAGITHYLAGTLSQALTQLRGALFLNGNLWPACFYQALCYDSMGYPADAAQSYRLVVELAARFPASTEAPVLIRAWHSELMAVAKSRAHPTGYLAATTNIEPQSR